MYSTDTRKFEEETEANLLLDDVEVLAQRVKSHHDYVKLFNGRRQNYGHSRTQWTRIHDGVQEHFSSHVLINGSSHQLPSSIYALKQISKQSWMLYKKRECERRKRLRVKLEKEREIEAQGGPANILLSMVDACEICKKLYVTVNLFWGITICDVCYFNEEVIKEIMKKRKEFVSDPQNNPFKLVEKVLAKPSSNNIYFQLSEEKKEVPESVQNNSPLQDSPEVVISDIPSPPSPLFEDNRPVSTYVSTYSEKKSDSEEEFIHEENSKGEVDDYGTYFSQSNFLMPDDCLSD